MRKFSSISWVSGLVLIACLSTAQGAKDDKAKDSSNVASSSKKQEVWSSTPPTSKAALKRETLPLPGSKSSSGGKSSESLRTASQTLFGYNGQNGFGGGGAGGFGGLGGQYAGFSPSYAGGRQGLGGGFGQYSQQGVQGAYNVLGQNQGYFGAQGQSPYYSSGYYGGAGGGGFNGYNPYASTGGVGGGYPFGSPGGFGGFGAFSQGQGYYPGYQGQIANRNYGFVNQGFGNPAFRNPQGGSISGSSGISSIPSSSVQVGTGLEVGSRGGFSGSLSNGGFPSASGQQYIVGNGIGQPAFISSSGSPGSSSFGFGGPGPYGLYSPGIPGGLYRSGAPGSMFGPYSLSGSPPPPSAITSRPSGATRLQTSGPNRFYSGSGPSGTYSPNSRERLYRFTSSSES